MIETVEENRTHSNIGLPTLVRRLPGGGGNSSLLKQLKEFRRTSIHGTTRQKKSLASLQEMLMYFAWACVIQQKHY